MTPESNALAALYLAFELGSTKWVLAFTARTATGRPRLRQIAAGDLVALEREILRGEGAVWAGPDRAGA